MTGTVFNIQRYCTEDGPGIRTTVFLKGCPLRCVWCHNPEAQDRAPQLLDGELCGKNMTVGEVMSEVLRDAAFYKTSGGGMTLSGGEPLLQGGFACELLREAKNKGLHTCVETCGHVPSETIKRSAEYTDIYLYDIKETDAERHRLYTGAADSTVLENLRLLDSFGKSIILRCPVIPGFNDCEEHLVNIARLANELRNVIEIQVEPYHDLGVGKYSKLGREYQLTDVKVPDKETVCQWTRTIQSQTNIKVIHY